jgi:uncharacterized protein (DUF2236 family)
MVDVTKLGALGPPPHRVHPDALLGPGSVSARLMLNPITLLGGPRALLLQLAHPLVAAGVADHSDFQLAPFDRLLRTLSTLGTVGFADPDAAARALAALSGIHRSVRGRSPEGHAYAAGDPRLSTWVHATIVDSYLVVERRWIGWLTEAQRGAFYVETLRLGQAFGARVAQDAGDHDGARVAQDGGDHPWTLPRSLSSFEPWMREQMGRLEVSEQARSLAPDVLRAPLSQPWGGPGRLAEHLAWPLVEALTADLLPDHLCRAYGLVGSRGRRRPTRAALAGARALTLTTAPIVSRGRPRPDRPTRVAAALTGQHL